MHTYEAAGALAVGSVQPGDVTSQSWRAAGRGTGHRPPHGRAARPDAGRAVAASAAHR